MAEKRYGRAGRFVWHDLMTTNPVAARAYYDELLGWDVQEIDMQGHTYPMIHAGGVAQGGIVGLDEGDGVPSHWISYLSVDDVDAACAHCADTEGAATCVPAFDIPGVGRTAVVNDPQGAVFSPFSGGDPDEEIAKEVHQGMFIWDELMTSDPEAALAFYGDLCGWDSRAEDMGDIGTYHLLLRDGQEMGGLMQLPAEAQGSPPAWMPYIAVDDVDATAAKVEELGGTVLQAPWDIPEVGRMTVTADPQGAVVAFMRGVPRE